MSFSNPDSILRTIGIIQPGMKIADLGCGAGYFSAALAQIVGEEGKVFAVDIQASALQAAKRREGGLENIEFIQADLEKLGSTGILSGLLDGALLTNTLFQSEDKRAMLLEAKRILRQGGFLVVIEWEVISELGPQGHKISKDQTIKLASEANFRLEREFPVDVYHYGLLFRS